VIDLLGAEGEGSVTGDRLDTGEECIANDKQAIREDQQQECQHDENHIDHSRDINNDNNTLANTNRQQQLSCRFCSSNPTEFVQEHLHALHFERFNFYFAKGINEILANLTISHVILFKDYLFLDDDSEYLKRSYTYVEYVPRFKLLSDFYAS